MAHVGCRWVKERLQAKVDLDSHSVFGHCNSRGVGRRRRRRRRGAEFLTVSQRAGCRRICGVSMEISQSVPGEAAGPISSEPLNRTNMVV